MPVRMVHHEQVSISILECTGLKFDGTLDIYCVIQVETQHAKTSTVHNLIPSIPPTWTEGYTFDVTIPKANLIIKVWGKAPTKKPCTSDAPCKPIAPPPPPPPTPSLSSSSSCIPSCSSSSLSSDEDNENAGGILLGAMVFPLWTHINEPEEEYTCPRAAETMHFSTEHPQMVQS
eukprot:TRINITY_DN4251_c1_g1_i2.p1 TRINITY_DN4251_c1_g1~~TRINITY_DN4251_c1_g1_i2.p1  ORF type:complete len:175 (-),score=46.43 TRINITY_DN4251_c1_g1_i2:66-590(-)